MFRGIFPREEDRFYYFSIGNKNWGEASEEAKGIEEKSSTGSFVFINRYQHGFWTRVCEGRV